MSKCKANVKPCSAGARCPDFLSSFFALAKMQKKLKEHQTEMDVLTRNFSSKDKEKLALVKEKVALSRDAFDAYNDVLVDLRASSESVFATIKFVSQKIAKLESKGILSPEDKKELASLRKQNKLLSLAADATPIGIEYLGNRFGLNKNDLTIEELAEIDSRLEAGKKQRNRTIRATLSYFDGNNVLKNPIIVEKAFSFNKDNNKRISEWLDECRDAVEKNPNSYAKGIFEAKAIAKRRGNNKTGTGSQWYVVFENGVQMYIPNDIAPSLNLPDNTSWEWMLNYELQTAKANVKKDDPITQWRVRDAEYDLAVAKTLSGKRR